MRFDLRQSARVVIACVLVAIFSVPPSLLAQTHVVSSSDMQRELISATQQRQLNVEKVRQFFSSEMAQRALKTAHMNPEQVKIGVASLSDAELAQLAARADKAQADFVAGTLSDRDLLFIILGIAALVLIIIAVR